MEVGTPDQVGVGRLALGLVVVIPGSSALHGR
jgi:hypothetical protein